MRMSCNGCRVLRKGCSPDCILKPCLQWIASPESQANATLFLAKFYGRAGLVNLITAGPPHLHQEIFRSLLYEACGRIINPVQGAIGLMTSGEWDRCQSAVDAVLQGSPVMMPVTPNDDDFEAYPSRGLHPVHGCDIRHIFKGAAADLHRVKFRNQFKRTPATTSKILSPSSMTAVGKFTVAWSESETHHCHNSFIPEIKNPHNDSARDDCFSIETVEPSLIHRAPPPPNLKVKSEAPPCDVGLELTLGPNQFFHQAYISASV